MPQPGLGGRRGYQPRGRGLGGSSALNAMIYLRGQREDYDGWAADGATGWAWNDVLPYFIKSESNERGANRFHGDAGPLNVADLAISASGSRRCSFEAGEQAGLPRNDDFAAETQEGVGWYQVTQKDGERWSAARAYLAPARSAVQSACCYRMRWQRGSCSMAGARSESVLSTRRCSDRAARATRSSDRGWRAAVAAAANGIRRRPASHLREIGDRANCRSAGGR